jgi:hypothetical protein
MIPKLDDILQETWPKVRERHLFPELPAPVCAEVEERVALEIKAKKISINRGFALEMSQVLEPEEILGGLLDHAVSHYLYCPWDLHTHLKLYKEAKQVLKDRQMAQKATDYFMDVVADTHCVSQQDTHLPKVYRHLDRGILDEAIHALYQRIWGVDLGVRGHDEISRRLSRLPYLDRSQWKESIRRFAKVIRSLLEEEELSGGLNQSSPMGGHKLQQYSLQEIEQGLQELARDVEAPTEFTEILSDFADQMPEPAIPVEQAMGVGPGNSVDADLLYYMKLADNYMLPIRKKPMKRTGSLYPHHHTPWEVGKPYQDIDPWTSFGKIMPGITQTWQRSEGEAFGRDEGVPDCMLVIDSSGSMTNPRQHLSYAVLGAGCACDAYLRNKARVAAYNFSDAYAGGRHILPYSRNRKEIYRTLCHYFGGGTRVLLGNIKSLQTAGLPDIFLITDMQITNLEILVQYFNDCKNRVTAVHIGDNKHVETFRRSMALRRNIGIYPVEKREDIPRIVIGKIREYLYGAGPRE